MKRLGLVLALLLLTGCNLVKLGYSQADRLISWELDRYFDLDNQQEDQADQIAQRLVTWHKTTQLPQYAALTRAVDAALAAGQAPQAVAAAWTVYPKLRDQLIRQASLEVAGLLVRLNPSQLKHLKAKLAEENHKMAEELAQPWAERQQEREEKILESFETWLGDLSQPQTLEIQTFLASQPDLEPQRLAFRQEMQALFLSRLSPRASAPRDPAHPYAQALAASSQAWQGFLGRFLSRLSPSQATHLRNKLQEALDLLTELQGLT